MRGVATIAMVWCQWQLRGLLLCSFLFFARGYAAAVDPQIPYSTYVLEDHCHDEEAVIPVYLPAWAATIVTLGQSEDSDYYGRDKHTCTLKVTTAEGFHLGGVVENIRIQGVQHPSTKRWECEDYIVFRTKGGGLVNQVLDILLPDKLFKGRQSEKLCGERYLDTSKVFRMVDTSSHSNVFSTMANTMELEYHTNQDLKTPVNNSFTVVISTFKNLNEHECSGEDQVMCNGGGGPGAVRGEQLYCVHARYLCDGHVNCALPGGGTDERGCPGGEVAGLAQYSAVFSSTIIIFIALGSIVGAMILLVILYTLVARARGDSNRLVLCSSPAESTTAVNYTASSESAEVAPTNHRRAHRHRHRGNRGNRRHDSITEEEEEEERNRGGGGGGGGGGGRSRSGGGRNRGRREQGGRGGVAGGGGGGGGSREVRRQNTLPGYDTAVNPGQPQEDKSQPQQPLIGVNQYNSFNRVNSQLLSGHLNPSAPDIQPYPPSYDILFPTDG